MDHGRHARRPGDRVHHVAKAARGAVVAPARPAHRVGRLVGQMLGDGIWVAARAPAQVPAAHVIVPTNVDSTGQKKFTLLYGWKPGRAFRGGEQKLNWSMCTRAWPR